MVLEQKLGAMSEHNTQNGGGNSDLQQSHSKKMSLATKLKKQRRTRQSGPDEAPSASVGSKSPVQSPPSTVATRGGYGSNSSQTDGKPTTSSSTGNYPSSSITSSKINNSQQQHQREQISSRTTCNYNAADKSKQDETSGNSTTANSCGSIGASLLHNKRRAMHLAKTRRSQDHKESRSPVMTANSTATSTSAGAVAKGPPTQSQTRNSYSPVPEKTSSSNSYSEPTVKKSYSNISTKSSTQMQTKNSYSPVPEKTSSSNSYSEPTVKKSYSNVSTKSSNTTCSNGPQDAFSTLLRKRVEPQSSTSLKPKPVPASDSSLVCNEHDVVTPAVSAESGESHPQSEVSSCSKKENSVVSHHEVVPWETTEEDDEVLDTVSSLDKKESAEESDRFSQVSTGRSVISNGVVAYDESIMSLARLDNFRSKANQAKADKKDEAKYPGSVGSSATVPATQDQPAPEATASEESGESLPVSAAKAAASQTWNSKRVTPGRAPSWKARASSPVVKEDNKEKPLVASSISRGKFSRQPSWVKSPAQANETSEAPPSPTPSNASQSISQPVSPARSAYSSLSYRLDRPGSPLLTMPKFSASRSDVGADTVPVPSAIRRDSVQTRTNWKTSPVVKKRVVQPEIRAGSPAPSWQSARTDQDLDNCFESPSPSLVSESESAADRQAPSNVPKAKSWSAKKQSPAWLKRGSSPGSMQSPPSLAVPSSPKRNSDSSWMKSGTSRTSKEATAASPAPRPRQVASSLPSIPKPSTSRQVPADTVDQGRPSASPRRHSSPSPSWAKPQSNGETEKQAEMSPPVVSAKTWSVNKQAPAWMKKAQENEEPTEKPPPTPVPTTKVWSAKKQTPSWMKKATEGEEDAAVEAQASPPPSPGRRNSTPSWMKPGQPSSSAPDNEKVITCPQANQEKVSVSAASPQAPGWKKPSPVASNDVEGSPTSAQPAAKTWRPLGRPSCVTEPKPAASPRGQSWKPRSPPLTAEKATIGGVPPVRKGRHSIGGSSETSKAPSAAAFVKKQRSPSPSVAQLQEQIFVTKLGVAGEPQRNTESQRIKPQKGPSSPSPQVKELQQKIFSPDKSKGQSQAIEMEERSPAAGWWKRVPNPPEIQTEHHEAPAWKHEGSNVNEDQSEVPTSTEPELPPPTKSWTKPPAGTVNTGAPTWLKDVAAFHSNSPKLPSQPPVWQPSHNAPPSADEARSSARASPMNPKQVDEGSSELMIMSSTSTTSRDDLAVQQEDSKSLIQMAADSVLIADYEQAMQRAIVESKSDEDDDSVGNSGGNTLPNDLPIEFRKALTLDESEENKEDELPSSNEYKQNHTEENTSVETSDGQPSQEKIAEQQIKTDTFADKDAESLPNSTGVEATAHTPSRKDNMHQHQPTAVEPPQNELPARQMEELSTSVDSTTGGHVKSKPKIAARAKALLGWATGRGSSPKRREESRREQEILQTEVDQSMDKASARNDLDSIHPSSVAPHSNDSNSFGPTSDPNSFAPTSDDPNSFVATNSDPHSFAPTNSDAHSFAPTSSDPHSFAPTNSEPNSFSPSDANFSGIVQDENGFPCAPFPEESIQGVFETNVFEANVFSSQPWNDDAGSDEKKDASDIMQYWPSEMDILNDSSEWARRDPGLDCVAMNSPELNAAENLVATAEKMLQKWSQLAETPNMEELTPRQLHTDEAFVTMADDLARDGWVDRSKMSSPLKEKLPSSQLASDDMWDLQQLADHEPGNESFHAHEGHFSHEQQCHGDSGGWASPDRSPPRPTEHQNVQREAPMSSTDPMWGSERAIDATWGVPTSQPDPFAASSASHFDMLSPAERQSHEDVFDPFGEDDEAFNAFHDEKLFSEPPEAFVAVDTFAPPFAPTYNTNNEEYDGSGADVFDTYYHPQGTYPNQSIQLKAVSQEEKGLEV